MHPPEYDKFEVELALRSPPMDKIKPPDFNLSYLEKCYLG
ncbi:hypothetical protein J14TS5_62300 [Paenibacillus lautus]|nr:hypothetical protein J14TS5_62300 [Paenibacillus lautus]